MDILKSIEHEQMKNKIPELKIGNTVRVHVRVKEGNRERIQVFEGIIIKKQGGGVNATFTVRKISYGVGVEKTFLVHSPRIEKIEVTRVGKARRAKLYYLRDRIGKAAKTKEQVGARIETKEITVKEDVVPVEEAPEEDPAIETTEVVTEEVVDTVTETPVEEVKEAPAKEAKTEAVEEVKEEKPAEEAKAEAVEEAKTETVEEVKEEKEAEETKPETVDEVKEEASEEDKKSES